MSIVEKIFHCMKEKKSFEECLETQMKEFYSYDETNMHNDLESAKDVSNQDVLADPNEAANLLNYKKRSDDKQELLSFIRNALLRNYKLKSSIKTTRF